VLSTRRRSDCAVTGRLLPLSSAAFPASGFGLRRSRDRHLRPKALPFASCRRGTQHSGWIRNSGLVALHCRYPALKGIRGSKGLEKNPKASYGSIGSIWYSSTSSCACAFGVFRYVFKGVLSMCIIPRVARRMDHLGILSAPGSIMPSIELLGSLPCAGSLLAHELPCICFAGKGSFGNKLYGSKDGRAVGQPVR